MNTTLFLIDTITSALIDELKANKVPLVPCSWIDGSYSTSVPVYREQNLVDLICQIARQTKATVYVTVHYQDGAGLDQRTYNFQFINGMNEEEFARYNEELEARIDEENELDIIRRDIEECEELGIPCDGMGIPLIKYHIENGKPVINRLMD